MPAKRKNFDRFSKLVSKRWNNESASSHQNVELEKSPEISEETDSEVIEITTNMRLQTNLQEAETPIDETHNQKDEYIFFQTSLLQSLFSGVVCKNCFSHKIEVLVVDVRYGFAKKVEVICKNCEESGLNATISSTYTSTFERREFVDDPNSSFDINLRISMAFLELGKNYAGIEQFSMIMDMKPFSKTSFYKYMTSISKTISKKIENILETARTKVKEANLDKTSDNNGITNLTVSYDGSWLTRGHTSLLGVGCVIDVTTGYVIDFEIMSKYCHECVMTKLDLGEESAEFAVWMEGHKSNCEINHTGSSGAMEMAAAAEIWRRSINFGFCYSTLLSDGDAKTLADLNELHIYGDDFLVEKEECINHVKKRLGAALRDLIKVWRNRGVTLGGRSYGALKGTTIDKLCRYYQAAIYRNKGDVKAMKNAIMAIIYHGTSTDQNPQHQFCLEGENSWCFYQAARAKRVAPGLHVNNIGTPLNKLVFEKLLPVFTRLSDESLLSRCAQCRTQNANESLHSLIWNKCPKEAFVSKKRLRIAVAEAIAQYNNGFRKSSNDFLGALNLSIGSVGNGIAHRRDQRRAKQGVMRNNKTYQKVRRAKKLMRKRIDSALKDSEGLTYKAGAF